MPQPATPEREGEAMNAHERRAVDDLANALQTIDLLSTRLRQSLAESAQDAVNLEGAADRAVRAIKTLQPKQNGR